MLAAPDALRHLPYSLKLQTGWQLLSCCDGAAPLLLAAAGGAAVAVLLLLLRGARRRLRAVLRSSLARLRSHPPLPRPLCLRHRCCLPRLSRPLRVLRLLRQRALLTWRPACRPAPGCAGAAR